MKKLLKIMTGTVAAASVLTLFVTNGVKTEAYLNNFDVVNENTTFTSQGQSDYGVYRGQVVNIRDYYNDYVNPNTDYFKSEKSQTIYNTYNYYNTRFDNYRLQQSCAKTYDYIYVSADDPITAFVNKNILKKDGDFILYGEEYGYYVHTQGICVDNVHYNETKDWAYCSTILLFDMTYAKEAAKSLSDSNNKFYFNIDVISQTSVITLKKNYFDSHRNIMDDSLDAPGDNDDYVTQRYELDDSFVWDEYDPYVVCPVFDQYWFELGNTPHIATPEKVFMSNLSLAVDFCQFNRRNLCLKDMNYSMIGQTLSYVTNNNNFQDEYTSLVCEKEKDWLEDLARDKMIDKVVNQIPVAGPVITTAIDQFEILLSAAIDVLNQEYLSCQVEEALNEGDPVKNCNDFNHFLDSRNTIEANKVKTTILGRNSNDLAHKDYIHYILEYNKHATDSAYLLFNFTPVYRVDSKYRTPSKITYMRNAYSEFNEYLLINKNFLNGLEYDELYEKVDGVQVRKNIDLFNQINGINYALKSENNKTLSASFNNCGLYSITPTVNSKYQIKISGDKYSKVKMLIWDADTHELLSYSNYWLSNQTTEIDLVAGKRYLIEVMADLKKDVYVDEDRTLWAVNREEIHNVSFTLKNLKATC